MLARLLLTVWGSLLAASLAWADETEIELNGFRLQQLVIAAEPSLGKPFKTLDRGEYVANAYSLGPSAYMVVEHAKAYPNHIAALQLTGSTTQALPFKGLMLGDPEAKVVEVLGKPDEVRVIEEPKVTELRYAGRNYTVELDAQRRLYSIGVYSSKAVVEVVDFEDDHWARFKAAILSKDMGRVMDSLRPDVEIYKGGKTLSIVVRYSDFVGKPDPAFVAALIGKSDSVLAQLQKGPEPEAQVRLIDNFGVGMVHKYAKGAIQEIVFFPYNGKYRVYEIAFR